MFDASASCCKIARLKTVACPRTAVYDPHLDTWSLARKRVVNQPSFGSIKRPPKGQCDG